MYKVGDILELKIEKIVFGGEGLAYYDNMAVFVPMSAIGDKVKAKIISIKKTYLRALIVEVVEKSIHRIDSGNISFEDNNGCDFAHLKYDIQKEYKNSMLIELLKNMSKIDITSKYDGILGANKIKNYRNKVAMPFFRENGILKTGFYKRKSHDIFSVKEDILISEFASEANEKICKVLNNFNVSFLRHLIIRNNSKGDLLIGLVVNNNKKEIKRLREVLEKFYNENSNIKSIYISIKNKENNVILGEENVLVAGNEYIEENIFDINFKIYLDSFFQINIEQVKKLYNIAISYLDSKDKSIIDAYSGTGTIAMLLSKAAKKVYGIELIKSAVKSAKKTAKENGIVNCRFICDKVENSIPKILQNNDTDYIVFDPPRKGIDKESILAVCSNSVKNVVYISCEPSTFARDLNIFIENGYSLEKISAVDMFPNTHHIEIVAHIKKEVQND